MAEQRALALLSGGYSGRVATVGADGWPYVVPLLYVWMHGEIWVHTTKARGHFRTNVEHDGRVCFELDEPGQIFPYGRFECDTSVAYTSVMVFGHIRIVNDPGERVAFFDALMEKYGNPDWDRPSGFYPRVDQVTVYAIAVERMTGKETPLPATEDRWPAADYTKTPHADPSKPEPRGG